MTSADTLTKPNLLCLPGGVINDIASWLDEEDLCSFELANKRIDTIASSPSHHGPGKRQLDLQSTFNPDERSETRAYSPEALRWLLKRAKRYHHILCNFSDATMIGEANILNKWIGHATAPPLLPFLLATCAPAAVLSLTVDHDQGDKFVAKASGSLRPQFGPELPFWAHLKQHLTELSLRLSPGKSNAQNLAALGMLTALENLTCAGRAYRNISGQALVWKLPHLTRLQVSALEDGELVLSCPKLAEARFVCTKSLGIRVEDAALAMLSLNGCQSIHFAYTSPGEQLQNLETLIVRSCSEEGRRLIEDVGLMSHLLMLTYKGFPSTSMPKEFPHSLRIICLFPTDWSMDLPGGLKGLPNLESFIFQSGFESWWPLRPMYETLPVRHLKYVQLGSNVFEAEELARLRELWGPSRTGG